ncbi:hypothetical protein [Actinoalloteichus hymeniacidonis]|uniref:Uncharacterized protein n=1 Tax=Actinoalloteichus hymeniacidonis TaxID=340345 RepID=A0AAC9MWZ6_9PSEU|nr:hypothetical protein [Actinoalloteichus hymeniacidonis]AOS61337.1 hypothetical protein TL08_02495 [Actinoalloteichus hymeniacidonis]MBB5910658.1 hypothetical protein [Actinoalloteichus hymeniacidonis]
MSGNSTGNRGMAITVIAALAAAALVAGFHIFATFMPTVFSSTTLRTSDQATHERYTSVRITTEGVIVPIYHWAGGEFYLSADEDGAGKRSLNCMVRPEDESDSEWISLEYQPEHRGTLVYRGTPSVSAPAQVSCVNDNRENVFIYTGADMDRAAAVHDRWWTPMVVLQSFGAAILVFAVGALIGRARGRSNQ